MASTSFNGLILTVVILAVVFFSSRGSAKKASASKAPPPKAPGGQNPSGTLTGIAQTAGKGTLDMFKAMWNWLVGGKGAWIKILIAITAGEAISMAVSSGMTPWATASWETPSVLQVGEYFWAHWFAILAIYGALVFILEEVGKDKDRRKRLISTLTTLTALGFLCYPVGKVADWVTPYSAGSVAGMYVRTNSDPNAIVLPPHGRSAPMQVGRGHNFSFTGSGFQTICVYINGSIGILGSTTNPCHKGPIITLYVQNMTDSYNTVIKKELWY